ncbi:MAG: DNA helicase II [Alphaproteobacteria bacterium]|nr:MAG: DNA helicase II [Alphaproteobacteria bacterium]
MTALQSPPGYLTGLNPAQRRAVETLDGPVLVLSGAGTGKTRVLTTRLAHLVASRQAWPSQVLAVTFTNKAAREMRHRVGQLIGAMAEDFWLGTFHAIAARMLRRHAELVGLKSNFTILDADDQLRLLKQILQAEGIDDKRWPARQLLAAIERWKDRAITPTQAASDGAAQLAGGKLAGLYAQYQQRLITLNACDFGDLLCHLIQIFQTHSDVLASWQERFKYIMVDEYQDTNVAQYLWLRLLAQSRRNLCVVGDEDQSIYGWRGAEIGNILKFEQDFPGAEIIRLEQNYRSTGNILAAASHLIDHNRERLGKTLWTAAEAGDRVRLIGVWDGEEEARRIGEEIEALQRHGASLDTMAVLVRAGFQTREFEERFITLGLPYRVIGGPRFYERQEIRDALAYLRLVRQPDDDLAFERIINTPKRGFGDTSLRALTIAARGLGLSLTAAAARLIGTDELKAAARKTLAAFLEDLARWRAMADGLPPDELAETLLDECGYTGMLQADKAPEAPGRLENLKELVRALEEFETLEAFLDHVALVTERAEDGETAQVTVMTLHAAKGLEFDTVFLPGWEEGLFPSQRSMDETGLKGLEEERRLAYVGLTRARIRAIITHAGNRRIHGQWQSALPSRFLEELPADHVEREAIAGLNQFSQSGGGGGGWTGGWTSGWSAPRPRAPIIDARATRIETEHRPSPAVSVGTRVFHQKFGYGLVRAVEGDKLEVAFDQAGVKKVMAGFVSVA